MSFDIACFGLVLMCSTDSKAEHKHLFLPNGVHEASIQNFEIQHCSE